MERGHCAPCTERKRDRPSWSKPRGNAGGNTLRSVSVRTCVTDTLACTRAALTLPQLKFFVPAGARVHRRRRTRCSLILLLPGSKRMFSRIFIYIYTIRDFSYLSFFSNYFYKYVSTRQIIFYYFKLNSYLFGHYSREEI